MDTTKKSENAVKKHSAVIQIEGNITLLQRKTWNVLLWNAYDELPNKDIHEISIQKLMSLVGYESHNQEYLREAALALMRCILQYNVLGKDDESIWGAMVLLAQAKIENGVITYAYPPDLRKQLYNPDMYARLDLDLQKRFNSKYALALWELCTDYLGAKRDYGETPWILLEDFRKVMGLAREDYPRFDNLKARVISPAIAEVNNVSDFRVTVEYQNKGRKIMALKFKMSRVELLPELAKTQPSLFPELDDMPALVRNLKDAGLSTQDAFEIWQQGFGFVENAARPQDVGQDADEDFAQYVREKIHLLKRRQSSGKVDNSTGFLREAIKKNYANPEYTAEQQQSTRAMQQKAEAIERRRTATIAEEKRLLEDRREKELQTLCSRVIEDFPVFLEQAITWATENVKGFDFVYKPSQTPAANYRDSIALRAMLNPYLERQHPKGFEDIRTRYNRALAALDQEAGGDTLPPFASLSN